MEDRICQFKSTDREGRTIKEIKLGHLIFYKRVRLKERQLKIFTSLDSSKQTYSYSSLSLLNYPRKIALENSTSKDYLLGQFLIPLIANSLLNLVLNKSLDLWHFQDSYQLLHGLTKDYTSGFTLSINSSEMEEEKDRAWLETLIPKTIEAVQDAKAGSVSTDQLIQSLVKGFLKSGRDYNDPYLEMAQLYLRKEMMRQDWAIVRGVKDAAWPEKNDFLYGEITTEKRTTLGHDLKLLEAHLAQAMQEETSLETWRKQIKEVSSNCIDSYYPM